MAIGDNLLTNTPARRTYQGPALAPIVPGVNNTANNLDNILVPGRTLETRNLYADMIRQLTAQGNPQGANSYYTLSKDLADRDTHINNIASIFDNLGQRVNQDMVNRTETYQGLDKDLLGKLADQWTSYQSMFGPQGEQSGRIRSLYTGLLQGAQNQQNNDAAAAAGMASRYGLSGNASRGIINQAQQGGFDQALKIYGQENDAINNLNQLFGQFSDNYLKNYKGVQDDYVKSLADSNFGVQNQMSNTYLQLLSQIDQMRLQGELQNQAAGAGGGGASSGGLTITPNANPIAPVQQTSTSAPAFSQAPFSLPFAPVAGNQNIDLSTGQLMKAVPAGAVPVYTDQYGRKFYKTK